MNMKKKNQTESLTPGQNSQQVYASALKSAVSQSKKQI